jgi:hypothetical protein
MAFRRQLSASYDSLTPSRFRACWHPLHIPPRSHRTTKNGRLVCCHPNLEIVHGVS